MAAVDRLNILLIGSGVIGLAYVAQFSLAGHNIWALAHGPRGEKMSKTGIRLRDKATGIVTALNAPLARRPDEREYDLIIVAVRADQLASTFSALRRLKGKPHVLFLGNNRKLLRLMCRSIEEGFAMLRPKEFRLTTSS